MNRKELENYVLRQIDKDRKLGSLIDIVSESLKEDCVENGKCSICESEEMSNGVYIDFKDGRHFMCEMCLVLHYQLWQIRQYMKNVIEHMVKK